MAARLLATIRIDPAYGPLTQRDMDWLADMLFIFSNEYLKGEHQDGRPLFVHEPPVAYVKSLSRDGWCGEP